MKYVITVVREFEGDYSIKTAIDLALSGTGLVIEVYADSAKEEPTKDE